MNTWRCRSLAAIAAIALVGVVAPPAASERESSGAMVASKGEGFSGYDWVLVRVTGGPQGAAGIRWFVEGQGTRNPTLGPDRRGAVTAYAMGGERLEDRWFVIENFGQGDRSVSTTRDLGGQRIVIRPASSFGRRGGGGMAAAFGRDALGPGELAVSLVMSTTRVVTGVDVPPPVVESGRVFYDVVTGRGTEPLPLVHPEDTGAGVGVVGLVASLGVTHVREVSDGIVGAVVYESGGYCTQFAVCEGTWRAPDGREGAWAQPGVAGDDPVGFESLWASGDLSFAGPAGEWSWWWRGVGGNQSTTWDSHAYGAWAPVGKDWPLFEGARVLGYCPVIFLLLC